MVVAKNSSPQMTHRNLPTRSPNPGMASRRAVVVVAMCASSDRGIRSMDRELAMPEPLGRGITPGTDREDFVEQTFRGRLQCFLVVEHAADVEVDVIVHRGSGARVARDLYHGRDRVARRRAEPGG